MLLRMLRAEQHLIKNDLVHGDIKDDQYFLNERNAGLEVVYEKHDFRRYQSGQLTVFSGIYIITRGSYCSFAGV